MLLSCPYYFQGAARVGTALQKKVRWGEAQAAEIPCACPGPAQQVSNSGQGHREPSNHQICSHRWGRFKTQMGGQLPWPASTSWQIITEEPIQMGFPLNFVISAHLVRSWFCILSQMEKRWSKKIFFGMGFGQLGCYSFAHAVWLKSCTCICVNWMRIIPV